MNNEPVKTPMPVRDPEERSHSFEEVALGYTEEMAVREAQRCLHCKKAPCMDGCPVSVRIPEFIRKIADRDFEGAYEVIAATNTLPAICGRVCPQETQCESRCVRGIKGESVGIGRLERFAADVHMKHSETAKKPEISKNGVKIAVIGSGPAGLTCAGDLAREGFDVTIFEALHKAGGVLSYGIPEFRLPKAIVEKEIDGLKSLGVKIETDAVVGRTVTVDELFEQGFAAAFIGSGAGLPQFMGVPGENLLGVYSANEFLTRVNLMKAYREDYDTPVIRAKTAVVVGGGNVAMDAARCARRLGAEKVVIAYRRSEEEMPARREEVEHAKEEGVDFRLLTAPKRVLGDDDGHVVALECVRMELGEPDASGRRRPVEIPGSEFLLRTESVIVAIGTSPNPLLRMTTPGLEADGRGRIIVDETLSSKREGVYAGGDAVTGAATVILAMGAGKTAAKSIRDYLEKQAKKHGSGGKTVDN